MKTYDLIIIGTGPAGLSAAIYAARYRLDFLCIGREIGGTANEAFKVENYPGTPNIAGSDLMKKMKDQAVELGATIEIKETKAVVKEGDIFRVVTSDHPEDSLYAKNILLTLGTERRKLQVKGEAEFHGKGVSYCATCDAFFFRNKTVAVVGGGDSALSAAVLLADMAERVYLIHRTDELRATPSWIETAEKNPKIEFLLKRTLKEIKGEAKVNSITFNENNEEISLDGVFIEIGQTPLISIIKDLNIELDDSKHIVTSGSQETNIAGIFAAGDLTTGSNKLKQIVTACAEGAVAASEIYKKIKKS